MLRSSLLAVLAVAGAVACDVHRTVVVEVAVPDVQGALTPAFGVSVVALPYDRDSLMRSREALAASPRPDTRQLDSLFAEFRGPFTAFASASYVVRALEDSARAGADVGPRLAAARAEMARRRPELDRARARLARGDSARAAFRRWEDITYRGWDSLTKATAGRTRREPFSDTTRVDGRASLRLSPGPWWIYVRAFDVADPNAEWYWNLPAPVASDTVRLTPANGRHEPRY